MQLMSLGDFVFSIDDLLFNQIRERRTWRHPSAERVGVPLAYQYVGVGENTLSIGGLLVPGQIGRQGAVNELSVMASTGQPHVLIDGLGYVYGAYLITAIDTTKAAFIVGGVSLKVDWSMDLVRFPGDFEGG